MNQPDAPVCMYRTEGDSKGRPVTPRDLAVLRAIDFEGPGGQPSVFDRVTRGALKAAWFNRRRIDGLVSQMGTGGNRMTIYIASRFRNREAVKALAARLHELGIETTQTWPEIDFGVGNGDGYVPDAEQKAAIRDLAEMDLADALIVYTFDCEQTPGGLHFEAGYAFGKGIPVVVIGPRVNVFYHHPAVARFETVDEYLYWLSSKVPHLAKYDDPMVTGRRSNSGKIMWKCLVCGRETTGGEKECRTFEMENEKI